MSGVRYGTVLVSDSNQESYYPGRLQLTEDVLTVQKEELVCMRTSSEQVDAATLAKERCVCIQRERVGGLGLSVKGGKEHNLPVLISRIFKEQAADKTGRLFVGDAILKVNDVSIDNYRHDDAVSTLKNAGDNVTLLVKYFRPASLFLARNRRHSRDEENNQQVEEPKFEHQWTDMVQLPLLCAYVTRYATGTDQMRSNAFEVMALDGSRSGVIQIDDTQSLHDWVQFINHNINLLNNQSMTLSNKLMLPTQQVVHMCWVCERVSNSKHWQAWKPQFLALKGTDLCIFDSPPIKTRDWVRCETMEKIFECMFRVMKDTELLDSRQHCFVIQTGRGESHYMSFESRQDMLTFEKAWYRANYLAVKHIQSKTFGCSWRGRISGLTLDLAVGFSLYDSESKSYMWSYRFSQLKGSSDDGKTRLKLHFLNDNTQQIETREVDCTNLQTLLFSMHAFLSAKLASVDPTFLTNL